MVEFWSDHFNQDIDKVQTLLVADQRDVIRKYAMTTFPQLLKASAHSASMMVYLDQNASSSKAPNQNYAREIMELHTLGVDGGYTQDDVAELSRVLTGWSVDKNSLFTFNANQHDTGNKVVMGKTITGASGAAGQQEGETMLDFLVNHPSTAKFIATKMLKWMVTPTPTDAQIASVSAVYRATGGDIKSMLRAMLIDSWITAAPMKLKRPFHFAISAIRSMNPTVTTTRRSTTSCERSATSRSRGTRPTAIPTRSSTGRATSCRGGTTRARCPVSIRRRRSSSTPRRIARARAAAAIDLLDQNFFGGEMPLVTRNALIAYAGTAALTDAKARELIALAVSANAFQWY